MGVFSEHLLSIVIFLPLVFAAIIAALPGREFGQIRAVTTFGLIVSFFLTLVLYLGFDVAAGAPEFQYEFSKPWVESVGIGYHIGVDGLAVSMILLTGFLGPIVMLSAWSISDRVKEFAISLLVLQTAMYGTFAALDLALFYVFWEAMLLPMYLMIGVWGSANRIYAAVKFFIYTFAASVLMLVAILYIYFKVGGADSRTFDYVTILNALPNAELTWEAKKYLFLAFAIAFAVKVPMFPLHTWLPDAHVEAPAPGSIILAGVLLKMGVFGFLRYAMPMFPDAAAYFRPVIGTLAVIGIVYGSLMSFTQRDMKKLVAYSSVAHLGFVMLGIMALSVSATTGAVYQMINHGISTGALFLLIVIIYERTHTRQIADYGGIAKVVPAFAAVFLLITMSSIGLPGTNGFIGEFLILAGSFTAPHEVAGIAAPAGVTLPKFNSTWLSAIAATGVVLGAVYMLKMYERVMLGPIRHPENRGLRDLSFREWMAVAPLGIMAVVMGLFPQPFLERIEPSSARYISRMSMGPLPVGGQAAVAPARPAQPAAQPDPHAGHNHPPGEGHGQPPRRREQAPLPIPAGRELQRLNELQRRLGAPPILRPAPQPGEPQNQ